MKTHLKNGQLSAYGFACGYVQREKHTPKGDVWMYKEHNTYHVRMSGVWDSFDSLMKARERFNQLYTEAIYMSSLQQFKGLLRMNDLSGDPWAVAMGAWFDCAAHLFEVGYCPVEWGYKVGTMGNHINEESPYYEIFDKLNADQLEEIGQLLFRYTNLLKRHGRDY